MADSNHDVLLLDDDIDTSMCLGDEPGYDLEDSILEDRSRKTRASVKPSSTGSVAFVAEPTGKCGRVIKGTAITKSNKAVKRKAVKGSENVKPAKVAKTPSRTFSQAEVEALKTQMCVDTMTQSLSNLTGMFQSFLSDFNYDKNKSGESGKRVCNKTSSIQVVGVKL